MLSNRIQSDFRESHENAFNLHHITITAIFVNQLVFFDGLRRTKLILIGTIFFSVVCSMKNAAQIFFFRPHVEMSLIANCMFE